MDPVVDQDLDYLDQFHWSKGLLIHLNCGWIKKTRPKHKLDYPIGFRSDQESVELTEFQSRSMITQLVQPNGLNQAHLHQAYSDPFWTSIQTLGYRNGSKYDPAHKEQQSVWLRVKVADPIGLPCGAHTPTSHRIKKFAGFASYGCFEFLVFALLKP